jgi:hypothetical protein
MFLEDEKEKEGNEYTKSWRELKRIEVLNIGIKNAHIPSRPKGGQLFPASSLEGYR